MRACVLRRQFYASVPSLRARPGDNGSGDAGGDDMAASQQVQDEQMELFKARLHMWTEASAGAAALHVLCKQLAAVACRQPRSGDAVAIDRLRAAVHSRSGVITTRRFAHGSTTATAAVAVVAAVKARQAMDP